MQRLIDEAHLTILKGPLKYLHDSFLWASISKAYTEFMDVPQSPVHIVATITQSESFLHSLYESGISNPAKAIELKDKNITIAKNFNLFP